MTRTLSCLAGAAIIAATVVILANPRPTFSGRARVIDGDTIELAGKRVRLWGIDAPEAAQPGGAAATAQLQLLISNEPVTCHQRDTDHYRRIVALCEAGGRPLNSWMVKSGNAVDYVRFSLGAFSVEEAEARAARRGIWAAPFERPEDYRRRAQKTH